ncbi:MAG: BamA/TamA family outer membrane protein [Synechococcales cyanobacterium T60_A2020_003]|nr:BamA/TamA family outer membrane protein [Synechococcales cyanobacterium T60_A2020_003]
MPGSVVWQNIGGNDQNLTFGILGGDESAGTAITCSDPWIGESSNRLGYAVNLGWMSTLSSNFNGGEDDVALPNTDEDFWEQRVGGGFQIMQQPTPEFGWAAGLSYQLLSVRNGMFSNKLFSEDEFGNTLTLSDDGTDTLLTANFALYLNEANDLLYPTSGTRVQFGLD